MTELHWFSSEECLALHDLLLADYGGLAGGRDYTMLESALAKPRQLLAYGQPTLAELAAAYAAGVVKNYPFIDGNKRTGFMLGAAFWSEMDMPFLPPKWTPRFARLRWPPENATKRLTPPG